MTPTLRRFLTAPAIIAMVVAILAAPLALAADKKIPVLAQIEQQAALTDHEHSVLSEAISREPAGNVTIACGGTFCRPLAESLIGVFSGAGWRVKTIDHGGLGIDGVSGIIINSCGMLGEKITAVLKKATTRRLKYVDDGKCSDGAEREIYVVIGAPAF